jgi:hypothetical protein
MIDTNEARTLPGVTQTTHGVIPHLRHPAGFEMPVKVRALNHKELPAPTYYKGALVYALPDGGEFIGETPEALR